MNMNEKARGLSRRQALLGAAGIAALPGRAAFARVNRSPAAQAPTPSKGNCGESLPVSQLNGIFGVDGTSEEGGVLLFDLGRSDQMWTLFGVSIDADWGFDSEITFQPLCGHKALVKYEFCLLDKEVNPVWNALRTQNLQPNVTRINALHNHFIDVSPEVKFLHGTALGDPVPIAKALYDVLKNHTGQPFESSPPGNTGLPNDQLTKIIGGMSMISGKVLTIDVDRKDQFTELNVPLEPASQVHSMASFQKTSGDNAIAMAEVAVRPDEADAVADSITSNGFKITALHNHEIVIKPRLYWLHAVTVGDSLTLAHSIRDALNHTDSKFEH
jgi:hypothetical protein